MIDSFTEEKISFETDGVSLSGVLSYPESNAPAFALLLCSPHPNFAGNMDNNVIRALAAHFAPRAAVLRFNYRGVGESTIHLSGDESIYDHWARIEETQCYDAPLADVRAAIDLLNGTDPRLPVFIIGYSFGAIVGLMIGMSEPAAAALIGIAPPLLRHPFDFLMNSRKPTLLVSGEQDFVFANSDAARDWPACVQQKTLPGQDHFFRMSEHIICSLCDDLIAHVLKESGERAP